MNLNRPLRGGCHCGRNLYIIQFPKDHASTTDPAQSAQVLFDSHASHRSSLATPLPTYLRVPLSWYHTLTLPLNPDETNAQIHRVYTPAREQHTMRHFCGFCGTPLSYWTESPRGEAEFIQLTLGSLVGEDLEGLEGWGLLPGSGSSASSSEEGEDEEMIEAGNGVGAGVENVGVAGPTKEMVKIGDSGRVGVLPWLDALTEGSKLGTLRRAKGGGTDRTGTVRVEWEVVEWTEDDAGSGTGSPRKRKLEEVEGAEMEGVQQ